MRIRGKKHTVRKMSKKTPDDNVAFQIFQQENCRFSYTLNYEQPVRCSIIGDTPLFFMDYEEDMEDDFDMFFSIEEIERSLDGLEKKAEVAEKTSTEETFFSTGAKAYLFLDNKDFITNQISETESGGQEEDLTVFLEKSRFAASLIEFLKQYNIGFSYSRQVENAAYDRKSGTIFINPDRDKTEKLLLAAKELRTAWQHKNGALLHPLTFQPDQAILVNRAQIADTMSCMVRVAWELQLAGEKEAWDRLESSSLADLAHAFAREAYLDFRTLSNGTANSAVFENWFLSERCLNEDRKLIQLMLADYSGYVFDTEQSSRQITTDLICALGSMPFGKNYLAPYIQTIITDPVFTEVRDRSNANFLWFIKFERSFRETEQELQREGKINSHETSRGISNNKNEWFDDNEEKQNIIFLPKGKQAGDLSGNSCKAAGGKVVYLQNKSDDC